MFQVEICSQQLEPIFLLQLFLCGTHGIYIYLVEVPPYSILNFQGKNFFTQNWYNITLNNNMSWPLLIYIVYGLSDNLPERVQILCHAHFIFITVLEHRIICCQMFFDLLLKSAFERIFNVMQLILVKINWCNITLNNNMSWPLLIYIVYGFPRSYIYDGKKV
jgi:hypothetical protein